MTKITTKKSTQKLDNPDKFFSKRTARTVLFAFGLFCQAIMRVVFFFMGIVMAAMRRPPPNQ